MAKEESFQKVTFSDLNAMSGLEEKTFFGTEECFKHFGSPEQTQPEFNSCDH